MPNSEGGRAELRRDALEHHEFPTPGKVAIAATKQLVNQRDPALAYSPGVAAACDEIVSAPTNAYRSTSRGNLVAVVTNGTAVLGLGDIGAPAAAPVHILTPSATVRRVVDMTALTVAKANATR